jgi:hypothetical protein
MQGIKSGLRNIHSQAFLPSSNLFSFHHIGLNFLFWITLSELWFAEFLKIYESHH